MGVKVYIYVFLTSALAAGEWSASRSGCFCIGPWVRRRAGLDDVEKRTWPYRDSNSDPSVVQPVASCYTDCAIPVKRAGRPYQISDEFVVAVTLLVCLQSDVTLPVGFTAAPKQDRRIYYTGHPLSVDPF
jgi:hypothetical protein